MEKKGAVLEAERDGNSVKFAFGGQNIAQEQAVEQPIEPFFSDVDLSELGVSKQEKVEVAEVPGEDRIRIKKTTELTYDIALKPEAAESLKERILAVLAEFKEASASDIAKRLFKDADKSKTALVSVYLNRLANAGLAVRTEKVGRKAFYILPSTPAVEEKPSERRERLGGQLGVEGQVLQKLKEMQQASASELAPAVFSGSHDRKKASQLYVTLKRLEEKGYVTVVKKEGNKTYYAIAVERPISIVPRLTLPHPRLEMPQISFPHIPRTYAATGLTFIVIAIVAFNYTGGLGFLSAPAQILTLSLEQQQTDGLQNFIYGVDNVNSHPVTDVLIEAILPSGATITDYGGAAVSERNGFTVLTWLLSQINPNEKHMFSFSGNVPGEIGLYATGLSEQERTQSEQPDKPIQAKLAAGQNGYRKIEVQPIGYLSEISVNLAAGLADANFTNETVDISAIPLVSVAQNVTTVPAEPIQLPEPIELPSAIVTPPTEENISPAPIPTEPEQAQNITQPEQPTLPTENITPPPAPTPTVPEQAQNITQTPPAQPNATQNITIPEIPTTGGATTPPTQPEQPTPTEPTLPAPSLSAPKTTVKIYLDPDTEFNGNEDLIGTAEVFDNNWDGTLSVSVPAKKYTENMNLVFYSDNGAVILLKSLSLKWIVEVPVNTSQSFLSQYYQNVTEEIEGDYKALKNFRATFKAKKVAGGKGGNNATVLTTSAAGLTAGFYDEMEINATEGPINAIVFEGVQIGNGTQEFVDLQQSLPNLADRKVFDGYSINPKISFTKGTLTATAIGSELYKCADWNAGAEACNADWVKVMDLRAGKKYTVDLSGSAAYMESSVQREIAPTDEINATKLDGNRNRLADRLEEKAKGKKELIRVVVSMNREPTKDDFRAFEKMGGTVENVFRFTTYGFAGYVDSGNLDKLSRIEGVILIDEDSQGQGNSYFVSKATGLRPLVWNTYGFSGDRNGSIAGAGSGFNASIIDLNGYSDGALNDPTVKLVGWFDASTDAYATPTDVGGFGHDSEIAGIAVGTGNMSRGTRVNITTSNLTLSATIGANSSFRIYLPVAGTVKLILWHNRSGQASVDLLYNNGTRAQLTSGSRTGAPPVIASFNAAEAGIYEYRGAPLDSSATNAGYVIVVDHPTDNSEGNYFRGLANNTPYVAAKSWASDGDIWYSCMMEAQDWIAEHRDTYKIRAATFATSAAPGVSHPGLQQSATTLMKSGVVTVVSDVNDWTASSTTADPGLSPEVITVGSMNGTDAVSMYTAPGPSGSGKIDLLAYGMGPDKNFVLATVDLPTTDAGTPLIKDYAKDDYGYTYGCSMAAPQVTAAAYLMTQAMESTGTYRFGDADTAFKIKSLLLLTATEVQASEQATAPTLDRGGKDLREGYGRFNPDAAIEAIILDYTFNSSETANLNSSLFGRRAWARHVDFSEFNRTYRFNLDVPDGADFDLYLYNSTPTSIGEPIILAKSVNAGAGTDETITANASGYKDGYLVVKWVSGGGPFTLTSNYGGGAEGCTGIVLTGMLRVYAQTDYVAQNPLVWNGEKLYFDGTVLNTTGGINNCSADLRVNITNVTHWYHVPLSYNSSTQTYRGNWTTNMTGTLYVTMYDQGYGYVYQSRMVHVYKGSSVAAYALDFDADGTNESVIENQHIASVFAASSEKPISYLLQKDQNVSYNFDDTVNSANATSRGGLNTQSSDNKIYLSYSNRSVGESLSTGNVVLNAFQRAVYTPSLSNVPKACGRRCTGDPEAAYFGCTDSTFDGCAGTSCNGNDVVLDMWTNASVVKAGDWVQVSMNFRCYGSKSMYTLNYNNGTGWRTLNCSACPSTGYAGVGAAHFAVFQADNVAGTHWIRGLVDYDTGTATCPTLCTADTLSDQDDINFTVASVTTPERKVGVVTAKLRDQDDDYLVFNVTNLQNLSDSMFFTDIFGKSGTSMGDEYFKLDNGMEGKVADLAGNAWYDTTAPGADQYAFVAVSDNSTADGANHTVMGLAHYKNTSNVVLEGVGVRNQLDAITSASSGLRLRYSAGTATATDYLTYLLVFTKGDYGTIEQFMPRISVGFFPTINFLSGTDGTKPVIMWDSPTPSDGQSNPKNWAYLNTTVTDASETSAFFDWNYSLRGYWSFERSNSSGVFDNSTYNNFLLFRNGTTDADIAPGYYGDGLTTDGTKYAEVPDSKSLNISGNLTLEFWVYDPPLAGGAQSAAETAEPDITVLDLQSYPTVGGNWTVRFNASGTADLKITAVEGTTWTDSADTGYDLKFSGLRCGDKPLDYEWEGNSVVVRDYSCDGDTSMEVSKVLAAGKHALEFNFGDKTAYAHNQAGRSLKTVEYFIAQETAQIATGVNSEYTFQIYIPEDNPSVKDAFIEVTGLNDLADAYLYVNVSGDDSQSGPQVDNTGETVPITARHNSSTLYSLTKGWNGPYTLNIKMTGTTLSAASAKAVITYEYDTYSADQQKTVYYFAGQDVAGGDRASGTSLSLPFTVCMPESNPKVLSAWAEVEGTYESDADGTIVVNVSNQGATSISQSSSGEAEQIYVFQNSTAIYDQGTGCTGYTLGLKVTGDTWNIGSGRIGVTYNYSPSSTEQNTVKRFIMTNSSTVASGAVQRYPFYFSIPESGVAVKSAFVKLTAVTIGTTSAAMTCVVAIDGGDSRTHNIDLSEKGIGWTVLYNATALYGMTTGNNGPYRLDVTITGMASQVVSAELIVTYDYSSSSTARQKTIQTLALQEQGTYKSAGTTVNDYFNIYLPDVTPVVKDIFLEISGSPNPAAAARTLTANVSSTSPGTLITYNFPDPVTDEAYMFAMRYNATKLYGMTYGNNGPFLASLYYSNIMASWSAKATTTYAYTYELPSNNLYSVTMNAPASDIGAQVDDGFTMNCTALTSGATANVNISYEYNTSTMGWRAMATSGSVNLTAATNPQTNVANGTAYATTVTANTAGTYYVRCKAYNSSYSLNTTAKKVTVVPQPPRTIAGKGTSAYEVRINNTLDLMAYVNGKNVTTQITKAWHHVAMTYNGTWLSLYVDGQYKAGTALTGAVPLTSNNLSVMKNVNGQIDELRIHARALSGPEINASYRNKLYRLYRNFTGLAQDHTYYYDAYAIDGYGNLNKTAMRSTTYAPASSSVYESLLTAPVSDTLIPMNGTFTMGCKAYTGGGDNINIALEYNSTTSDWANILTSGGQNLTVTTNPIADVENNTVYESTVSGNSSGIFFVRCRAYNSTASFYSGEKKVTVTSMLNWSQSSVGLTSLNYAEMTSNVTLISRGNNTNVNLYKVEGNGTAFMSAVPASIGNMKDWQQQQVMVSCSPTGAESYGYYHVKFLANSTENTTGQNLTAGCTLQSDWWNNSWAYRVRISLNETKGLNRTFEPVNVTLSIDTGKVLNCTKEMRVTDINGVEIPSQVINESYGSGYCTQATVLFTANASLFRNVTFYAYYGNTVAAMPSYSTDISWSSTYKQLNSSFIRVRANVSAPTINSLVDPSGNEYISYISTTSLAGISTFIGVGNILSATGSTELLSSGPIRTCMRNNGAFTGDAGAFAAVKNICIYTNNKFVEVEDIAWITSGSPAYDAAPYVWALQHTAVGLNVNYYAGGSPWTFAASSSMALSTNGWAAINPTAGEHWFGFDVAASRKALALVLDNHTGSNSSVYAVTLLYNAGDASGRQLAPGRSATPASTSSAKYYLYLGGSVNEGRNFSYIRLFPLNATVGTEEVLQIGSTEVVSVALNAPASDPSGYVGDAFTMNCTPGTGGALSGVNLSLEYNKTGLGWRAIATSGGENLTAFTNPGVNVLNGISYAYDVTPWNSSVYNVRCRLYNSSDSVYSATQQVTVNGANAYSITLNNPTATTTIYTDRGNHTTTLNCTGTTNGAPSGINISVEYNDTIYGWRQISGNASVNITADNVLFTNAADGTMYGSTITGWTANNYSVRCRIYNSTYSLYSASQMLIVKNNTPPTHNNPLLNATSINNYTTDNITCYNQSGFDADGDAIINTYNWYVNGQPAAVLNMPFDTNASEGAGGVADLSGHANNGTLGGTPEWTRSAVAGNAYYFSGNESIGIQDSGSLDLADSVTVEAWVNSTSAGPMYSVPITLSPATLAANQQVEVALNETSFNYSHARADGGDIMFYDYGGNALDYWIENWTVGGDSTVWVKVPTAGTTAIAMYYGNPSATAASDGDATFQFFDDFSDIYQSIGNQTLEDSAWGYVVRNDTSGVYYMYYVKNNGPGWDEPRRANSTDLAHWTDEAILPALHDYVNPAVLRFIGNSTPVLYKGYYWMAARDNTATDRLKLFYTTSLTNNTWTYLKPLITVGTSGDWDDNVILTSQFVREGDTYYIAYQAQKASDSLFRIGIANATAPDGDWTKEDSNPQLSGQVGIDTTDGHIGDPILYKENNMYYLFYTGGSMATCDNFYASGTTISGSWTKAYTKITRHGISFAEITKGDDGYYYLNGDDLNYAITHKYAFKSRNLTGPYAKWFTWGNVTVRNGYLQVGTGMDSIANQSYALLPPQSAMRHRSLVAGGATQYVFAGLSNANFSNAVVSPHSKFGSLSKTQSGSENTSNLYSPSTYQTYDIIWAPPNAEYYQNGTLKANHSTYVPTAAFTLAAYMRSNATAQGSYVRSDWAFVRQYSGSDPYATVGNETASTIVSRPGSYGIGTNSTAVSASINNRTLTATSVAGLMHVVLTYDRNASEDQQRLYVNGTLVAQGTLTETISASTQGMLIGAGLNGTVDEVRVYNRSLTAGEVEQHYVEGARRLTTSVVTSSELAADDVWMCQVTPSDGYGYGLTKNSSALTINAVPGVEGPMYSSVGQNTTYPNAYEAVLLYANWTKSLANLDYAWLATNETGTWQNKTVYGSYLNFGSGTWSNFTWQNNSMEGDTWVAWKIYANDSAGTLNLTGVQLFKVGSKIEISLEISNVSLGMLAQGASNSTSSGIPSPFRISNDGNVKLNITINASSLFTVAANPTANFTAAANNTTEGETYDKLCTNTTWFNMPAAGSPAKFVCFLQHQNNKNSVRVDIAVTIPNSEPTGAKSSTVTFIATMA